MATNFRAASQSVLYTALNGNVAGWTIYDHVPFEPEGAPGSNFPFIALGDNDAEPWDNDSDLGNVIRVNIHFWSRYLGRKEVNEGMDAVYGLLHRAALTSAGYKIVDSLMEFSNVDVLPDGKTRHGIQRFRLTIQEV